MLTASCVIIGLIFVLGSMWEAKKQIRSRSHRVPRHVSRKTLSQLTTVMMAASVETAVPQLNNDYSNLLVKHLKFV